MLSRQIRLLMGIGFALVIGLMAMIFVIGYQGISSNYQQLRLIVDNHHTKTKLLTEMHQLARSRLLLIFTLTQEDDIFIIDEQLLAFSELSAQFMDKRKTLEGLLPFQEPEHELYQRQTWLISDSASVLNEVAEMLANEQTQEALTILQSEAVQAQDRLVRNINTLRQLQNEAMQQASSQAEQEYHQNLWFLWLLSTLGFAIATWVLLSLIHYVGKAHELALFSKETLKSLKEAVITTDSKQRVSYMNPAACALTGWTLKEARGLALEEIAVMSAAHESWLLQLQQHTAAETKSQIAKAETPAIKKVFLLTHREGHKLMVECSKAEIQDDSFNQLGQVLMLHDVGDTLKTAQSIARQARHDGLTGLVNRLTFEHMAEALLNTLKQKPQQVHVLCYMDLDHFKPVNDICGHAAGDELLQQIARLLESKVRQKDILARLGGDEFALLLKNCKLSNAQKIVEHIRQAIQDYRYHRDDKVFDISISIGVVEITAQQPLHLQDLLNAADSACYGAKRQGRNQIYIHKQSKTEEIRAPQFNLSNALNARQLTLYGQEIFACTPQQQGELHQLEILLRLYDTENAVITPGAFLPDAERQHMMPDIDRWVLQETLRHLYDSDFLNRHPVTIVFNLSDSTVKDEGFIELLKDTLSRYPIDPKRLCFEVRECYVTQDLNSLMALNQGLHELGCQFGLDDFGCGVSMLSYLKRLQVDYLKLYPRYVQRMLNDITDYAMVGGIQHIAKTLDIQLIAKGVESRDIQRKLQGLGIHYFQGDILSAAQPLSKHLSVSPQAFTSDEDTLKTASEKAASDEASLNTMDMDSVHGT